MFATLVNKELRVLIISPKFIGTFLVCTLLILLSIFTGIREYRQSINRYESAARLAEQELDSRTTWGRMSTKVYRAPDPMQIFVSGLEYDIGRWSEVSGQTSAKLKNSAYADEPIYALFRVTDFAFIVQFILSLFAILFTYNAVNGEREDGTLRLVFSNAVSRAQYLMAKCTGAWLGLVVPISIPILLGILIINFSGIPLMPDHWIRIGMLMLLSLILFSFFIVLGVFISSLTKHSSVSFLVSLILWIFFVLIIPRGGIMSAGNLVNVPRVAEIESQISGFAKESWEEFFQGFEKRQGEYHKKLGIKTDEITDEYLWTVMQWEDSLRHEVEEKINQYDIKLHQDLQQRKTKQENLALTLSRFSPASAYQLGVVSLAGTDLYLKRRYEESINTYRNQFNDYVKKKQAETGDTGYRMIALTLSDSNSNFAVAGDRKKGALDLSDRPEFQPPRPTLTEAISMAIIDFGLLAIYTVLTFMGSFIAFLRYDLR